MKTEFGTDPTQPLLFAGYASGSIEFAGVFNDDTLTPQVKRDQFDALVEAAVTAESGNLAGTFVSILIVGHADRDDTPGRTSEDRRRVELENSGLRAESAEAFLFNRMADRLVSEGLTVPADVNSLQAVEIRRVPAGSSDLLFLAPGNDEQQRRSNRRVQFFGTAFTT
jgi:hypothetical protein